MARLGVFTDAYRAKYATVARDGSSTATSLRLSYFKIGEGGNDGGVPPQPKVPDPSRTDVEAQYDQAGTPLAPHDSYFEKSLTSGDMSVTLNDLTIVTIVDILEGNDDGFGNDPTYYELGIFDEDDTMIVYCTFDERIKTDEYAIQNTVTIEF